MEEKNLQIEKFITLLGDKDFNLYFFVLDTKGNPTAGVANVYEHVKVLNKLGYKAHILYESEEYSKVGGWLGEEYDKLSHISIKSTELKITAADFIIIPEIFYSLMEQCKSFPCKKIVFSQNYNYILDLLPIGSRWDASYGFRDVITTTEKQSEYVKSLFPGIGTHVVPVSISDSFTNANDIKDPIILFSSRDDGEAMRMIKSFYLQYPQYQWLTFKEIRNIPKPDLHKEFSKCCLTVWLDPTASFGTIPLESMACGTPVIGVIPNIVPEWMEEVTEEGSKILPNGIWTDNVLNLPELISTYMNYWLEDSLPDFLDGDKLTETPKAYSAEKQEIAINNVYSKLVEARQVELKSYIEQNEK